MQVESLSNIEDDEKTGTGADDHVKLRKQPKEEPIFGARSMLPQAVFYDEENKPPANAISFALFAAKNQWAENIYIALQLELNNLYLEILWFCECHNIFQYYTNLRLMFQGRSSTHAPNCFTLCNNEVSAFIFTAPIYIHTIPNIE